jgi:hypothetical protein
MVRGLLILETGEVQQIGELTSLQGLISGMENVLPQLKNQERQRMLTLWSPDELERAAREIKSRENKDE